MGSLEEQLAVKTRELATLQASYDEYMQSSAELEQELEAELEASQNIIEELHTDLATIEEERDNLRQQVQSARDDALSHKEDVEDGRRTVARLETENELLLESMRIREATETQLSERLEAAEEEAAMLATENEDLAVAAREAEARLGAEVQELRGEVVALRAKAERFEGVDVAALQARVPALEAELAAAAAVSRDAEVAAKAAKDAEVEQVKKNYVEKIAIVEAALRFKEERDGEAVHEAQAQQKDLARELEDLKHELQQARRASQAAATELEQARGAQQGAQTKLTEALEQLEEARDVEAGLTKDVEELQTSLEKALKGAEEARGAEARLTKKVEDLQVALDKALQEAEELRAAAAASPPAAPVEDAQAAAERDELKRELADARDSLREAVEAAEAIEAEKGEIEAQNAELEALIGELEAATEAAAEPAAPAPRQRPVLSLVASCGEGLDCAPDPSKYPRPKRKAKPNPANLLVKHRTKRTLHEAVYRTLRRLNGEDPDDDGDSWGGEGEDEEGKAPTLEDDTPREVLSQLWEAYMNTSRATARLSSRIQQLTGGISVCCRVRPRTGDEKTAGPDVVDVAERLSDAELGLYNPKAKEWRSFAFDKVFGPECGQEEVFTHIEPLALSVLQGMDVCIFAYGQTGSGKTYTMQGYDKTPGMSYLVVRKLFDLLNLGVLTGDGDSDGGDGGNGKGGEEEKTGAVGAPPSAEDAESPSFSAFKLRVTMLEIYNEELRDLLDPELRPDSHQHLEIRQGTGGETFVPNLTQVEASDVDGVLEVFDRGYENRVVAATNVHERSSRSHLLMTLEVHTQRQADDASANVSRLHLVDLAGSERVGVSGVTDGNLREAKFINKSLSALGDVIHNLDQGAGHVPYRNSKLTYLLKDALSGNNRTAMFVTVCPTSRNYDETNFTLGFATRVRSVKIPAGQRRGATSKNLQAEVKRLRAAAAATEEEKKKMRADLTRMRRQATMAKSSSMFETRGSLEGQNRLPERRLERTASASSNAADKLASRRAEVDGLKDSLRDRERSAKRQQVQIDKAQKTERLLTRRVEERDAEIANLRDELRELRSQKRQLEASRRGDLRRSRSINTAAPGAGVTRSGTAPAGAARRPSTARAKVNSTNSSYFNGKPPTVPSINTDGAADGEEPASTPRSRAAQAAERHRQRLERSRSIRITS